MSAADICHSIVESFPFPVVFVDLEHVIRYMNRAAIYHYCAERGHGDLIGKSLFDCHLHPRSPEMIRKVVDRFKKDAKEIYFKVNDRNLRVYISPVRSPDGELIGYYERFEMNLFIPLTSR